MSLSLDKLKSNLYRAWTSGFESRSDAARALALAYHEYAGDAQDASGDGVLARDPDRIRLVIDTVTLAAPEYAAKLAGALVSYWTGVSFAIGTPPPPPSPPCTGTSIVAVEASSVVLSVDYAVLYARILSSILTPDVSLDRKVHEIASALHGATLSAVLVKIDGTDAGGNPASHVCGVQ